MDTRILESQKHRDVLAAFWARKASRYVTAALLRTRITPNQTTALWGAISVANSYLVYRTLIGEYYWLAVVPLVYVLTYVLDCVDGEIARVRNMTNPVGGKLLDGVCHRATEYSLLAAFVAGAAQLTASPLVLYVAILLIVGESLSTYADERRTTVLRVDVGFTGLLKATTSGMYLRADRWSSFSVRRKLATITGQVHYKSIYAVILVAYISGTALLAGLAALAVYKHVRWIRLILKTLADVQRRAATPSNAPAEAVATVGIGAAVTSTTGTRS